MEHIKVKFTILKTVTEFKMSSKEKKKDMQNEGHKVNFKMQ